MKTVVRPETEMKESGLQWLGEIPNDWKVSRVGNFFSFSSGDSLTNEEIRDEGMYLVYGANGIRGYYSKYNLAEKRILLGRVGALAGNVHIVDGKVWVTEHALIASNKLDLVEEYYGYVFESMNLIQYSKSSAQPVISGDTLQKLRFPVPKLSEQQAIADYLDETCSKIDEIIAEAKASIVEYKELRESVISNATTRGIKKNRCMKPSGVEWLPEIPSDWNVLSPKVVFAQRKDRAIKGERQLTASQKHGIMYQDDYMKEEGVRIVTVEKDFSILKHVEPDDFVISMRSFQGGLEYSYLRGCISSAYVMLIPNHKYVYSEYYKWFFKSDKYINALQSTSDLIRDGQALRYANFVKLKLFDIPIEEQKEIADYLNKEVPKIDSLIAEKESLINDLESYKKSLIYEVVTGKRRVV